MKYRLLGRAGFQVSDIGYGLWGMGEWTGSHDERSMNSLQTAVDSGCTFYDSAWAYGDGKSDMFFGELMRRNPGKALHGASKIPPKNSKWPASANHRYEDVFPAAHVLAFAEKIRAAFSIDSIDLLQFHVWDDSWTDEPEFQRTIETLKKRGTIKAFGLSLNRWEPWNGMQAIGTGLIDAIQVIYNIFDQSPEDELFPLCREMNIGVIARVPLDEGSLGGNLSLSTRFPSGDWRARYFGPENLGPTLERVEALARILPEGMTLPEMALRFVLSNPIISTTIVGMRTPEHVKENIEYSDRGALSPDLLADLKQHRWDRLPAPWSD